MRAIVALSVVAILSACSSGPDYQRPAVGLSERYGQSVPPDNLGDRWWLGFNDRSLDAIVSAALAGNTDLSIAAARIDQARALAQAARAAFLPSGDVGASADRVHQSLETPVGSVSNRLGLPRDYSSFDLGARASWELDLFGGLRRDREAARAELAAAGADAAAVRLSVVAETVDAYLQLRGLQARLAVADSQLETERQLVRLVRQQVGQGLVADRELNRVSGELAGIDADRAPIRAAIKGQINRIDVLTGRQAGFDAFGLAAAADLPAAPEPGGELEPASLLRRRPDLVAAEHRLIASNARIGSTLADYYPHVSLRGLLGVASLGVSSLFTGDALQADGGGAIRWRLFDFGRIDAEVAQARGRNAEQLAAYRGAVLRATEDVETALSRLAEARRETAVRSDQVRLLTRSRGQARQGYAGGALSLLTVLEADRALLVASDRLVAARLEVARSTVSVIRAFGGGWDMKDYAHD